MGTDLLVVIALADVEQVQEAAQRGQRHVAAPDGPEGAHSQPAAPAGLSLHHRLEQANDQTYRIVYRIVETEAALPECGTAKS